MIKMVREFSEKPEKGFKTLINRAFGEEKIRLTLYGRLSDENSLYVLEGILMGYRWGMHADSGVYDLKVIPTKVNLYTIKDENLRKFTERWLRCTKLENGVSVNFIPVGAFIKNYEFLTPPYFNAKEKL